MSDGKGSRIRAIAKKEIIEFSRDWRTIIAIIVIPLLMFPLLFILFPLLLESEAAELDAMELNAVIQTDNLPENLAQNLTENGFIFVIEEVPDVDELSYAGKDLERIRNNSIDGVLRLERVDDHWNYAILHISTSERSNELRNRMLTVLIQWEQNEIETLIEDGGLDVNSILNPLRWDGDIQQGDVAISGE
jgi:hypothetical protein